jgi:hypothetical protein
MADLSQDMDQLRELISRLIGATVERLVREKRTAAELSSVGRKLKRLRRPGKSPPGMTPGKVATVERLFGFGDNGRHYLRRGTSTRKLHPITKARIECVREALVELGLLPDTRLLDDHISSWRAFLTDALATVEGRHSSSDSALGLIASHVWIPQLSFFPDEALAKLQQPFSAEMRTDCKLHLTENQEILINTVVDQICRSPDMSSFKHLIRVMNFFRLYDYRPANIKLWFDSADLVHEKLGGMYMAAFLKTRNYRDLRIVQDQKPVYQSFSELGEQFSRLGDVHGFCESVIHTCVSHLFDGNAQAARRSIKDAMLYYRGTINTGNAFSVLYDSDPSGLLGDLFGALARAEICLGNLSHARKYSIVALNYASKLSKWHIMGNICETLTVIDFSSGRPELGHRHHKDAVRCFEIIGDSERAKLSQQLLTGASGLPWAKLATAG